MVIANFKNYEYGIEAVITTHKKGFAVTLKDITSNETVPFIKIFPKKEDVIETAQIWAQVNLKKA